MRKKKVLKVALFSLAALGPMTMLFAEPVKVGDVYYEITGANTVKVVADHSVRPNINSYKGVIDIPEQVEIEGKNYMVTQIGEDAFRQAIGVDSVYLPNTITSLAERAFYGCSPLPELVIPSSVRVIGADALSYSGTKKLVIEEGLDSIGPGGMRLLSVTGALRLPASLRVITPGSIGSCHQLEEFVVAEDNPYYKSVDGVVFSKDGKTLWALPCHKNSPEYSVPSGVEFVQDYACSNQDFVTSFIFPRTKMKVGKCSFAYNYLLKEVKNAGYIIEMDSAAFAGNDRLVLFEPGLYNEVVGDAAFASAGRFTSEPFVCSFNISSNLKSIGSKAFFGSRVSGITVPASVDTIAPDAFLDCSCLEAFNVKTGNQKYVSLNGSIYSGDLQTLCWVPAGNANEVFTFPVDVRAIGDYAFYGAKVKVVSFPETVEKFGRNAFSKSSLIKIDIPAAVTELPFECFSESAMTSINVPATVGSLGEGVFRGCTLLKSVNFLGDLDSIPAHTFLDCYTLTDVALPSSIRKMGNGAFMNCYDLLDIAVPDSCESLGQGCFVAQFTRNNHGKLETVTLGSSLAEMGDQCFAGQDYITSITAKSDVPPLMENPDFTFSAKVMESAEITVYDNVLADYKLAPGWDNFVNWNTMTGIGEVLDDNYESIDMADGRLNGNGQYYEVYNLYGQCLYRGTGSFAAPSRGMYLVKKQGNARKLML